MSEPSLAITPDINDQYQILFWSRLSIMLLGQDTVFDAWYDWAYASGDTDDQWFADRYSGYVMQYWYDNQQAVIVDMSADPNETATLYGTLWNNNSKDGNVIFNGWCMQDIRVATNLGGHCLFPGQTTNTDGTGVKTVSMTAADFTSLQTLWADQSVTDGTYDAASNGN